MVKINVDGKEYKVTEGQNLLQACLSVGINIPYFCYHPAMGSVGACRQCAVKLFKDEDDDSGKIAMSCMESVKEGMLVSVNDEEVKKFRAMVIESMMLNHPHDCPVCDEGGECHLQDMTVMTGHSYRRSRFPKRTFRNQYLGPFLNHEMNRCIHCYRCVRFYGEYAGGKDLNAFSISNHVYFGREKDGVLENEFSGNLAEVCPTGVFTDKTLKKHYTRKWDLTTAPSVCVHCSLGCNTIPGERYGTLRRIRNRYNEKVNGYFLCDRGRFGYEFVSSSERIMKPLIRNNNKLVEINPDELLKKIKERIRNGKLLGIGSPRASMESNFALKQLVGQDNFFSGISEKENIINPKMLRLLNNWPVKLSSLKETEKADFVLIMGEDITMTAPMLALSLRQTRMKLAKEFAEKNGIEGWKDHSVRHIYQHSKAPVYAITPVISRMDEVCENSLHLSPRETARFGFALANRIDPESPPPDNIPEKWNKVLDQIRAALLEADNPLIVSGSNNGDTYMTDAIGNITLAASKQNKTCSLFLTMAEANSMGLTMLDGKRLTELQQQEDYHLLILENDLYRRLDAGQLLDKAKSVTVIDHINTETSEKADFILPAGTFAESSGTMVNNEGRAQRFYRVIPPKNGIKDSWKWLDDVRAGLQDSKPAWANLDACINELCHAHPGLEEIKNIAPVANYRQRGQKLPRAPKRYSGRTAMDASKNVHEPQPAADPDSPLSFTMEGNHNSPPTPLTAFYWAPGWNSVQALNKYQNIVGDNLHHGQNGIRLFKASRKPEISWFEKSPPEILLNKDEILLIPAFHIFGSDELSSLAPAIAERAPEPYIRINKADADKTGLNIDDQVQVKSKNGSWTLPVEISEKLPEGVAEVPSGLRQGFIPDLPAKAEITKIEKKKTT